MSKLSAHELLVRSKNIIADRSRWCQRNRAMSRDGTVVDIDSRSAQSFCSLGAMLRVCHDLDVPQPEVHALIEECGALLTNSNLIRAHYIGFNDTQPHEKVMHMWERAILAVNESSAARVLAVFKPRAAEVETA